MLHGQIDKTFLRLFDPVITDSRYKILSNYLNHKNVLFSKITTILQ